MHETQRRTEDTKKVPGVKLDMLIPGKIGARLDLANPSYTTERWCFYLKITMVR